MMKYLPLVGLLCALATVSSASARDFGDRDLRGAYGYSLSGTFGQVHPGTFVETGVFVADGRGSIEAEGRTVVNGTDVLTPTYDCAYEVAANGFVDVECARSAAGATVDVSFSGVLDARTDEFRFIVLPSEPPFDVIEASGTSRKQ
jgi:hypothetical protein